MRPQSTADNEEREREREREETSYASAYRQQQQQHALHLQQQQQQQAQHLQQTTHFQMQNRQPTPAHFQHPDNIINENRQNIRHHIKPKSTLINQNNPDTTTNNNNNNINLTNNNHKFGVQQVNSSSKMLDNQKYQKYFSKRKLLAQYEQEMQAEKRNRMEGGSIDEDTEMADQDNNRPLNMRRSQSDAGEESSTTDNGRNSVGLNLIQNIKKEKGDEVDSGGHKDLNGNDEIETGTVGFYGTHLSKLKHSILEPNIVLQSDEVNGGAPTNSITSTLQNNNTNLSQKTAS